MKKNNNNTINNTTLKNTEERTMNNNTLNNTINNTTINNIKEEENAMNNTTLNNTTLNNTTTMNKEEENAMNNNTMNNNKPEIFRCVNEYTQEIIDKINSVTGADFERDSSDALRRLMNIANEYQIDYDQDYYNFVTDDDVEELIKFELDSSSWDLMDLVNFMRGVNFDSDDLYLIDCGKLRNVTLEDFEYFKEDLFYNLNEPSHYITVTRQSNCWVYGVDITSQTRSQHDRHGIFSFAYPERTYDLNGIYEDFDVEEESKDFLKDLEYELIDQYIDEYLEEHHLHRGRVEIINFA